MLWNMFLLSDNRFRRNAMECWTRFLRVSGPCCSAHPAVSQYVNRRLTLPAKKRSPPLLLSFLMGCWIGRGININVMCRVGGRALFNVVFVSRNSSPPSTVSKPCGLDHSSTWRKIYSWRYWDAKSSVRGCSWVRTQLLRKGIAE